MRNMWKAFKDWLERRYQQKAGAKIDRLTEQLDAAKKVYANLRNKRDAQRKQLVAIRRLRRSLAKTKGQKIFHDIKHELQSVQPDVQREFAGLCFIDSAYNQCVSWLRNLMGNSIWAAAGIGSIVSIMQVFETRMRARIDAAELTLNTATSNYLSQKAAKTITPLERKVKNSDFLFFRADRLGWMWPYRLSRQMSIIVSGIIAAISTGIALLSKDGGLARLAFIAGLSSIPVLSQLVLAPIVWIKGRAQAKFENKVWDRNKNNLNVLLGEAVSLSNLAFKNAAQKQWADSVAGKDVLNKYKAELGKLLAVPSILSSGIGLGLLMYNLFLNKNMDVGTAVALWTSCTGFMMSSMSILGNAITLRNLRQVMVDRYKGLQASKVYDLTYGHESLADEKEINAICLDHISYHHRFKSGERRCGQKGNNIAFVSDETIFVEPGITIVGGETGVGKTTLFNVLRKIDDVDGGCIAIGHKEGNSFTGTKLTDVKEGELGNLIGVSVSAADFRALDEQTVLDIAKMQNPNVSDLAVQKLAEMMNMGDKLYSETGAPRTYNSLSDGERRRILLIQALLSDKKILILDEPTTGVDAGTADLMMEVIDAVLTAEGKDRIVFLTTHRPEQIRNLHVNNRALELSRRSSDRTPVLRTYPLETPEDVDSYIKLCNGRVVDFDRKKLREDAAIVVAEMRKVMESEKAGEIKYEAVKYDKEKEEKMAALDLMKSNSMAWLFLGLFGKGFKRHPNMRNKLANQGKASKPKGKEKTSSP